jgi:hypothetical protein
MSEPTFWQMMNLELGQEMGYKGGLDSLAVGVLGHIQNVNGEI